MDNSKNIGKEMLQFQAELADAYGYRAIPPLIAMEYHEKYRNTLPECFKNALDGAETKVYTHTGTLIGEGIDRIVIGDYGAFVEISPDKVVRRNIKVKEGQEYRYLDPQFAEHVKYLWLTARDNSDCKIYFQKRKVAYADYKPGYFYISPFECITK